MATAKLQSDSIPFVSLTTIAWTVTLLASSLFDILWMAAILFGLAHYIGGIPSGLRGVLITTFLGWFFGKCLVDSEGFFWAWLFHTLQDTLPFTLMVLSGLAKGSG